MHVLECPVEPRASPVQPAAAETAAAAEQSLAEWPIALCKQGYL